MEFRHPTAAAELNAKCVNYLTKGLVDPIAGKRLVEQIISELGNSVEGYPDWHPILTTPPSDSKSYVHSISELSAYEGIDHTVLFVKGFLTCPYGEEDADALVERINKIKGLRAERLKSHLYSDHAYPVVVKSLHVEIEADGTIRSRDALAWCVQSLVRNARSAQVAETWWNIRSSILGTPHGSRSSLFVNQHTGGHMRKILDALNDSGIYGPIYEHSLEMFSHKKRKAISETLIRTAVDCRIANNCTFEFELRGEVCEAKIRDTFGDGDELHVQVVIGDNDLCATGFYYPNKDLLQSIDPTGKQSLAKKF
ncbi:hypothetical protein AB5A74_003378, partial [Vibrio cholerae]